MVHGTPRALFFSSSDEWSVAKLGILPSLSSSSTGAVRIRAKQLSNGIRSRGSCLITVLCKLYVAKDPEWQFCLLLLLVLYWLIVRSLSVSKGLLTFSRSVPNTTKSPWYMDGWNWLSHHHYQRDQTKMNLFQLNLLWLSNSGTPLWFIEGLDEIVPELSH